MTPNRLAVVAMCHRCVREAECVGECMCPADGMPPVEHAQAGYCPLGLFESGPRPDGWPETPAEAAELMARRREEADGRHRARLADAGRKLWGELHAFALTPDAHDPAKLAAFLEAFNKRVPCGDCKKHWGEILARLPPDAARPFEWSVEAHDAVNVLLGKPVMGVGGALAVWTTAG